MIESDLNGIEERESRQDAAKDQRNKRLKERKGE